MSTNINSNYGQFYQGMRDITNNGMAAGAKNKVAKYQFNRKDEEGNYVMDKMSREETFRAMKEISSQYSDDVIVEFSGDGLGAFEEHIGKIPLYEDHKEIPEAMLKHLEGPEALTSEQLDFMNQKHGDDLEAIMKRADPDAYKEYKKAIQSGKEGTLEGLTAGFRYMYQWVMKKAQSDPKWMDRESITQRAIDDVSKRFKNADVYIGDSTNVHFSGEKKFGIILSDEELNILKNGSDEEKDKIYKIIEERIKKLSELKEKNKNDELLRGFKLGLNVGKKNTISYLAQSQNHIFTADSAEELFKLICGE